MKKTILLVALLIGATYSMNAMPITDTNVQTEISTQAEYVIDAYMNAGEDEVFVSGITGQITGIMPGVLHWESTQGGIMITQLFKAFEEEKETPGANFTIIVVAEHTYTINVHVQ